MSKNKIGEDSPIPKFIYLNIRRRGGVESLTTLEEGEFKVPIDGCINKILNCVLPWLAEKSKSFRILPRARTLMKIHRYTKEIPEPAPFLFHHGAQIWGLRVFPVIKITVVRQVPMSPCIYCDLGVKIKITL